ncbi:MAG: ABC transporter permease [Caldilineaceae bacterium]
MDTVAMIVRPIPYYIFAFALLLIFAYFVRWFPVSGGTTFGRRPSMSWSFIKDALALVPAGALHLHPQRGRLVPDHEADRAEGQRESYVQYAKLSGVREGKVVRRYVIRNAMLPQITGLGLSLGLIFSGALITEIVFSYPGLGSLLYNAIVTGDYNLIMGITVFSILAITTSVLIVDLLYPFFDPRIRYQ